ncbi:hypothetical protein LSCM1_08270 [Leishmania martiniquensis]|uniref:Uncharacterized protein n=1 Tax=Leishmania martiniquensis TaxID=1580590 RepID=A0A836KYT8_9TRYP|nr:hypothetical protein LSCM1_08270 [Leishmania martiniquensis]
MSAVASPSAQAASPHVFISSPSSFPATGPTSSFVKVHCGDDECVPLSKQCTGGTFQGVLSDLATRVSRGDAQTHGSRSHRVKAVKSVASAGGAVPLSSTVVGGDGNDDTDKTSSAAGDRADATEAHREGVHGGGAGAGRRPFAPPSASTAARPTLKGAATAAPSAVPFHSTGTDAAAAPAGGPLADGGGTRMPRAVVYRRAELLPLSFVRDVASNSKVTALYKQHLQLQEQLRRHQLEQKQQLRNQWGRDDDVAAALGAMAGEGGASDAASNQETAGDMIGRGCKAPSSKPTPRRRGMPSVGRGGGGACGNRSASPVSSAATSAAGAAALAAQTRTQLWAALRNTIPFFGVLTMPVHTPVEPLISLPAATTTTPPSTGVVSAATAVCSGSYVLLGCRERPRETVLGAEAAPVLSVGTPYMAGSLSSINGASSNPSMSAVERLVEQAHEASVARLPPLCSDGVLRVNGLATAPGGTGEGAKRSPQRSRSHLKEPHAQHMSQQMLPMRCVLQPTTNRVVPMPPPLPEDIAAGYGAARLVTQSLDQSAANYGGDLDDSVAQSGARTNGAASGGPGCGHPGRGCRRSLQGIANVFSSAADAAAAASTRLPPATGKGASLAGLAKGAGRGSGGMSSLLDEVGVEGGEDATPIEAQRALYAASAVASRGSCSPPASLHASSIADSGASAAKEGDKLAKGAERSVPLSAAAIALLTPSTRFTVQLSSCTVTLAAPMRKGGVANATDAPSINATGATNGTSGVGGTCGSAIGCGELGSYADELAVVFDGLDVLWHGPNGEEALLQWVLDEYSILLKQRMAAAIAQWTSMVRAGDTSAGAAGGSSSKASKARRQPAKESLLA